MVNICPLAISYSIFCYLLSKLKLILFPYTMYIPSILHGLFQHNDHISRHRYSHYENEMVMRQDYLIIGICIPLRHLLIDLPSNNCVDGWHNTPNVYLRVHILIVAFSKWLKWLFMVRFHSNLLLALCTNWCRCDNSTCENHFPQIIFLHKISLCWK